VRGNQRGLPAAKLEHQSDWRFDPLFLDGYAREGEEAPRWGARVGDEETRGRGCEGRKGKMARVSQGCELGLYTLSPTVGSNSRG
jgi:phosphoribosyl 1,2-cyclic phosphodiesterase